MEEVMNVVAGVVANLDGYILAASALVVALAGIAKFTKTKKDDEALDKAGKFLDRFKRNKKK